MTDEYDRETYRAAVVEWFRYQRDCLRVPPRLNQIKKFYRQHLSERTRIVDAIYYSKDNGLARLTLQPRDAYTAQLEEKLLILKIANELRERCA